MKNWNYVSKNTINELSLHDCDCTHIYYENNRVILKMEWMEIMPSHPHNNFSEAHQSGEGIIELNEPQIIECTYEKAGIQEAIFDIQLLELKNLQILDFEELKDEYGFENKMFLTKASNEGIYDNVVLKLRYKSSTVKFNTLNDKSWFVDFGEKFIPSTHLNAMEYMEDQLSVGNSEVPSI